MISLKTTAAMALCAACAISLVACKQATSSDNVDTPSAPTVTITPATVANMTGSWKTTSTGGGTSSSATPDYKKSYNFISETTTTYNADGTYSKQRKRVYTSTTDTTKTWTDWNFDKGTISVKDNVLTTIPTDSAYSNNDTVDIAMLTWAHYSSIQTSTTQVVIINGKIYTNVAKRQTTGSGITGTWVFLTSSISTGSTPIYSKTEYVITDGKTISNYYSNSTGTFAATDIPSSTITYTFILNADGTCTFSWIDSTTSKPGTQTSPVIITGDWLCIGDGATKS